MTNDFGAIQNKNLYRLVKPMRKSFNVFGKHERKLFCVHLR